MAHAPAIERGSVGLTGPPGPISLEGWIYALGGFEHLIAYGELSWPDFVVHDGCILPEGFTEDGYRGFLEQTGGDKRAVEAMMNHVQVVDLVQA